MGEFGNKFRKEREKKGISLEEISNATKISSRMLLAIEEEQFDRLPGGVFNKGFIRAYAKHIGLNEEQAVEDYLACLRQSQTDAQDVWDTQAHPAAGAGARARNSPAEDEELPELQLPRTEHVHSPQRAYGLRRDREVTWRLLALVVLVIVLAIVLWHRHLRREAAAAPGPVPATQPASQPSAQMKPAVPATSTLPAGLGPVSPRPPTAKTAPTLSATSTRSPNPPLTPPTAATETNTENQQTSDLGTRSEQAAIPLAAPPETSEASAAPLTLVIRASENSWISVTADGRSVIHELLIAPAHTSIHAGREIVVKVGNAAGVTFLWNGQELPAQGSESEVKTLAFDAGGMRILPPSPPEAENP